MQVAFRAVDVDVHIRVHQATVLAVVLALGAAAAFGVSSALQHRSSNQQEDATPLDPSLLLKLVRSPLWLLGGLADAGGLAFQAAALDKASLVLVEPLLSAAILVATPLAARLDHRRVTRRELVLLVAVVAGLAAFMTVSQPNEGRAILPTGLVYLLSAASLGLIGVCLGLASRVPSPSRLRAALIALAGGVALGSSSALIKTFLTLFGRHGLGVLGRPATYALLVLGGAALVLTQNAFQAGPLGPTLAILTVTEPLIGVVVGLAGLNERVAAGAVPVTLELLTAAATAAGLVALCLNAGRAAARPQPPGGITPAAPPRLRPSQEGAP